MGRLLGSRCFGVGGHHLAGDRHAYGNDGSDSGFHHLVDRDDGRDDAPLGRPGGADVGSINQVVLERRSPPGSKLPFRRWLSRGVGGLWASRVRRVDVDSGPLGKISRQLEVVRGRAVRYRGHIPTDPA